jgi:two-component system nitrate/nitrite response regulator NarL
MSQTARSLIIIDDHPMMRRGVADLISMEPLFQFSGEASNGPDGIELAMRIRPDFILLDLNMEGMTGLQTLRQLKITTNESKVIILTVSDNEDDIVEALRNGASGYLLKDMEPEDMLSQLRKVADGHLALSSKVSELMAKGLQHDSVRQKRNQVELTRREQQVLELIVKGLSNKLIARELDIVESTVKVHVKHMLQKYNFSSRTEAAIWAIERNKTETL